MVETPSLYTDMTAKDNLICQYELLGMPDLDGIDELLDLVKLSGTGKKRVKNFSLGMRQRLGIAVALCGNPDFLILDEPVNGLDPEGIVEIRELILKLNRERDMTVLVSSHILDELSRLATHYGFIEKGSLIKEISSKELENRFRKYTRIAVSNIQALCPVLDNMGAQYTVSSENTADIYDKIDITSLALSLSKAGCNILSITEQEESLESYYINLVGGEGNE